MEEPENSDDNVTTEATSGKCVHYSTQFKQLTQLLLI